MDTQIVISTSVAGFCFLLGFFALYRNPRNRLHRSFGLFNLANGAWALSGYTMFAPTHDLSVTLFRSFQIFPAVVLYFVTLSLQDLAGIYRDRSSILLRRSALCLLIVAGLFHQSPLVLRDVIYHPLGPVFIREVPGPLYPAYFLSIAAGLLANIPPLLIRFHRSTGALHNQLKFVLLSLVIAFLAVGVYVGCLLTGTSQPLIYDTMNLLVNFSLAFAIFRYRLFDFEIWVRRVIVYGGVYLALLAIPFVSLVYLRALPVGRISELLWLIPPAAVGYGLLFMAAPALTTFLRDRIESRSLGALQRQLDVVRTSLERFGDEKKASLEGIADHLLEIVRSFYAEVVENPVSSSVVYLLDREGRDAVREDPPGLTTSEDRTRLLVFFEDVPPDLRARPLTPIDIGPGRTNASSDLLEEVQAFMQEKKVEVIAPCVRNGVCYGLVLLGAKSIGIFSDDELRVIDLAASQAAAAVRNMELVRAAENLRSLDETKRDMIADITHEFKTPIAVVMNGIDILRRELREGDVSPERIREYLDLMGLSAGRLNQFIENLLEIAKLDRPNLALACEDADLAQLVREEVARLSPIAREKNVEFEVVVEGVARAQVDSGKIRRVVMNLLSNAVRFTDRGRIAIRIESGTDTVRIAVSDTGIGLEPVDLTRVFDRFYQAGGSTDGAYRGTGLGLAIVKGWTEAHGGRVWAESPGAGKGATFVVELPRRWSSSLPRAS